MNKNKYMLSSADYIEEAGKPVVLLRGVDEKGNSNIVKVRDFKPYFYVKTDEYEGRTIDKKVMNSIYGTKVVKKEVKLPRYVNKERKKYSKTWESDILFPIRYIIDKGIKSGFKIEDGDITPVDVPVNEIQPTKLFFDIETNIKEEAVNLDPDKTDNRIISIVCRYINPNTGEDDEKVIHNLNEAEIIKDFINYVISKDPDMLLAWNIYFDIGNIFNRSKKHNVNIDKLSPVGEVYKRGTGDDKEIVCKGRQVIDLMHSYDKYYTNQTLDTKALEEVCENEIGIEVSDFDYDKMWKDNWKKHTDEIIKYNKLDVERMVKLDEKLEIINHFEMLRRATGCSFEQAYRTTGFADVMILRWAKDKFVLPKASKKKKDKFSGGLVKIFVKPGIYEWVIYLDFSSHYPTGIDNYNMSPETVTDKTYNSYSLDTPKGKVNFKKKPKGMLPEMLQELQVKRNNVKKKRDKYDKSDPKWDYYHSRQYTLKQIINSFFGYFGYPGSRLYKPKLAASVTAAGRKYINDTIEFVENNFNVEPRYSDTDSILFTVKVDNKEDAIKEGKRIEKEINKFWGKKAEENGWYGQPEIECEKVFKKFFFGRKKDKSSSGAKKRYVGRKIWEEGKWCDEIDITGYEVVRTDQSKPTKKSQRGLFEILLSDDGDVDGYEVSDKKIKKINSHLNDIINTIKNPSCIEDVAQPKNIRKNPDDYAVPYSIHGILYSNRNLDKEFGITKTKCYLLYLDKYPKNMMPYINIKDDETGVTRKRKVSRIALDEDDDIEQWKDYIDYDMHIEKQVKDKVDHILDSVGLSYSEVMSLQRQKGIDDFF